MARLDIGLIQLDRAVELLQRRFGLPEEAERQTGQVPNVREVRMALEHIAKIVERCEIVATLECLPASRNELLGCEVHGDQAKPARVRPPF
jgi:hypothetical protein